MSSHLDIVPSSYSSPFPSLSPVVCSQLLELSTLRHIEGTSEAYSCRYPNANEL